MDRRCVFYKKPLLESGTLGTKGNVQVSENPLGQQENVKPVQDAKLTGLSPNPTLDNK